MSSIVPLSPEVRKLKTLIGFDNYFKHDTTTTNGSHPSNNELVDLLQKQDTMLDELCHEMDVCRADVGSLRQASLAGRTIELSLL
jgi:hypothetical protein